MLGVAVLIPILLNIIVMDLCYAISPGALLSATNYLVLSLLIVWFNREKAMIALQALMQPSEKTAAFSQTSLAGAAVVSLIIASVFWMETSLVKIAGY